MKTFIKGMCLAAGAVACAATASPLLQVKGGMTTIHLSEYMQEALVDCDVDRVKPSGIKPDGMILRFKVVGGLVDPDNLVGEASHNGGIALACPELGVDTEVVMQNFLLDLLGESPVISGVVTVGDEILGRLPLFVPGGAELEIFITGGGSNMKLSKADLALTAELAALLADSFGIIVEEGEEVGRAWTKLQLRQAAPSNSKADDNPGNGKDKNKNKGDDDEGEEEGEGDED